MINNFISAYFGCSTNWRLNSGKCFRIFDQGADWVTARSKCQSTPGADLAVIRSQTEFNFVNRKYSVHRRTLHKFDCQ